MLKPIVVVEDDARDLELTLLALEKARLANEVVILRDGAEAIDYLSCTGKWESRERGLPAVMLLDLKLPKKSGLEVLEFIKGKRELRQLPVVMLTSSREEVDLDRSYSVGVNAYVVKPVKFSEFVAAVQELGGFWAILNEPPPGCARPNSIRSLETSY
jgi:CheY-like chemotaxis protein